MTFEQGQSGNPAGRPKGSQDKRTKLRALFENDAEELIEKIKAQALEGDPHSQRLWLERVAPRLAPVEEVPDDFSAINNIINFDGYWGNASKSAQKLFAMLGQNEINPQAFHYLIGQLKLYATIEANERKNAF